MAVTLEVLHIFAPKNLQGHLSRPSGLSVPFTASGGTWPKLRNKSQQAYKTYSDAIAPTAQCLSLSLDSCPVHQILQNSALLPRGGA